jgi:hypothetical protein
LEQVNQANGDCQAIAPLVEKAKILSLASSQYLSEYLTIFIVDKQLLKCQLLILRNVTKTGYLA